MPSSLLWDLFVPILSGLFTSFVLEQMHLPRPSPVWLRRIADVLMHIGIWLTIFLIEFVQFRRPWLAVGLTSAIFYVLILINHAKFRTLREPFIYQDFDYLVDAMKHPRLYLPFFGIWKIVLCLLCVGISIGSGVFLEIPVTHIYTRESVWLSVLFISLGVIVLLFTGNSNQASLSFIPSKDFSKSGLLAMLWRYGRAETRELSTDNFAKKSTLHNIELKASKDHLRNTIVVQSESFFDPRRTFDCIDLSLLSGFDQACQESILFGQLSVPAWGANTVRTEFSFLTGVSPEILGIDQFNPYRRVYKNAASIADSYRQKGYRTICIHPYPASFYRRDIVYPVLGFDEFIDIKSFDFLIKNKDPHPFVSDQILTDKVIETLKQSNTQPVFIFVITMENHGPMHLESIPESETQQWIKGDLPSGCQDLPIYLRHLANADQMVVRLINYLSEFQFASQLLWYGDHVPVMPVVYQKLGTPDGLTDYFLWRSGTLAKDADLKTSLSQSKKMSVWQLAVELLK